MTITPMTKAGGTIAGRSRPVRLNGYVLRSSLVAALGGLQLSGINAILYYLNDIFERAGFSAVSSEMQAVAIGLTNLVFTLEAMYVIDRLGRKPLLLTGAIGCAISLAGWP